LAFNNDRALGSNIDIEVFSPKVLPLKFLIN
jgi:hypothetical protein